MEIRSVMGDTAIDRRRPGYSTQHLTGKMLLDYRKKAKNACKIHLLLGVRYMGLKNGAFFRHSEAQGRRPLLWIRKGWITTAPVPRRDKYFAFESEE